MRGGGGRKVCPFDRSNQGPVFQVITSDRYLVGTQLFVPTVLFKDFFFYRRVFLSLFFFLNVLEVEGGG